MPAENFLNGRLQVDSASPTPPESPAGGAPRPLGQLSRASTNSDSWVDLGDSDGSNYGGTRAAAAPVPPIHFKRPSPPPSAVTPASKAAAKFLSAGGALGGGDDEVDGDDSVGGDGAAGAMRRNHSSFSEQFFTSDGFQHFSARVAHAPGTDARSPKAVEPAIAPSPPLVQATTAAAEPAVAAAQADGISTDDLSLPPAFLRTDTYNQLDFDGLVHFSPRVSNPSPQQLQSARREIVLAAPPAVEQQTQQTLRVLLEEEVVVGDAAPAAGDAEDAKPLPTETQLVLANLTAAETLAFVLRWEDVAHSARCFGLTLVALALPRAVQRFFLPSSSCVGFAAVAFALLATALPLMTQKRVTALMRTATTPQALVAPVRAKVLAAVANSDAVAQLVAAVTTPIVDEVVAPVLTRLAHPPKRSDEGAASRVDFATVRWLVAILAVVELGMIPVFGWIASPVDLAHCAVIAVFLFHPMRVAVFPRVMIATYNFATAGLSPGNTSGSFSSPLTPPGGNSHHHVAKDLFASASLLSASTTSSPPSSLAASTSSLNIAAVMSSGGSNTATGGSTAKRRATDKDPWEALLANARLQRERAKTLAKGLLKTLILFRRAAGVAAPKESSFPSESTAEGGSGEEGVGEAHQAPASPMPSPRVRQQLEELREVRLVAYDSPDAEAQWARNAVLVILSAIAAEALYFSVLGRPLLALAVGGAFVALEHFELAPRVGIDALDG